MGGADGNGTWDTSTWNWYTTADAQAWTNFASTSANNAIFGEGGASPDTVTLGAAIDVRLMTFQSMGNGGSYTISTSSTDSLTTYGGITLNSGAGPVTISSSSGTGLIFGAANTWTNNSSSLLTVSTNITNGAFGLTVAGSGGLTMNGTGMLTLTGANTYTGATATNAGTLLLDFSAAGAPANGIINDGVTISSNDITSGSALALGGGTLSITGATTASTTNSQAFNGTTVNSGYSVLAFTPSGGNTINLDLGAITRTAAGGTVDFTQPSAGTANIYSTTANPTFTGGTNTILGGWALWTPVGSTSPTMFATSAGTGSRALEPVVGRLSLHGLDHRRASAAAINRHEASLL